MQGRPSGKTICPACGQERDNVSFIQHAVTGKRTAKRHDTCFECRSSGVSDDILNSAWDWAAGLCKATSMAADWGRRENPTIPKWTGQLDPVGVRALFHLQDGRCALTQMPLMIPPDYVRIPRHGTLADWVKTLQPETAGRVPVIQRVCPASEWAPGSVVLVASVIAPYIDWAGGLEAARLKLGQLQIPSIPTAAAIAAGRARATAELKAEYAQERERMRHEQAQANEASIALSRL